MSSSRANRQDRQGESDRQLTEQFLRRRTEEDFRLLYRRHAAAVYRFALRLAAGSASSAEEVAQEAWVRAVKRLPSFDGHSPLRTWLLGVTHNCWREHSRRERRLGLHLVDRDDEPGIGEPKKVEPVNTEPGRSSTVGLRIDLLRALDRLPDGYREVVLLHDVEGLTHEEIGEVLAVSAGTSKSQLSHARRRLRRLLSEGEHDQQGQEKGASR